MSIASNDKMEYEDSKSSHSVTETKRGRCSKRKHWMKEEDKAIQELVSEHGTKDWTLISKMMNQKYGGKKRTPKQCRERWHNYLDPEIKKEPMTEEEERKCELKKTFGNTCALVANDMENLYGQKIKEITFEDLNKYLVDNEGDYDDVEEIYENALDFISNKEMNNLKTEAINLLNNQKELKNSENIKSRGSASDREINGEDNQHEQDPNKVGFYVLMKILKIFRDEHKHELYKFKTLEFDQESNVCKISCANKNSKNKCDNKEFIKEKEDEVKNKSKGVMIPCSKYSQNLVPTNIRSLFSNMKTNEITNQDSDDILKDQESKAFNFQYTSIPALSKPQNIFIKPLNEDSEPYGFVDKSPPLNTLIKSSFLPSEPDFK